MRFSRKTTLTVLLTLAQTCGAQGPAEIHSPGGKSAGAGFVDISLSIESMNCDTWSSCSVRGIGLFRGRPVGVDVIIQSTGNRRKVTYRSIGTSSDELLSALATLYKIPSEKRAFAQAASADIIFLEAGSQKMSGKVFFSSNGPASAYAELYTNIDRGRRVLEIHEKDPEYRQNVLRGLSR